VCPRHGDHGETCGPPPHPVARPAPRRERRNHREGARTPLDRPPPPSTAHYSARHANRRAATPSSPSAVSAMRAAGRAPARIKVSSTTATPRKMYTPSPPPPLAAATVAVPTLT